MKLDRRGLVKELLLLANDQIVPIDRIYFFQQVLQKPD